MSGVFHRVYISDIWVLVSATVASTDTMQTDELLVAAADLIYTTVGDTLPCAVDHRRASRLLSL